MLLREILSRRRACAIAAGAAVAICVGLAPPAQASEARHYERVSPADKGQGDIVGDGLTTVASRSGDGVVFNSRTPFGDTVGSGVSGQTQFVAQRGADGWTTHAITPTPRPDAYQTFFAQTRVQSFSDDLRTAVVWAYDLPGVAGDAPLRNNIYVEDAATRTLEPVTISQQEPLALTDFLNFPIVWGISADARHLAFVTATQMLPNAAQFVPNVYKWDDGVLSLAGILPDGRVPVGGSDVVPSDYRGAMSADGTRQLFSASAGGPTQLYMRIGGTRTAWISQPEGSDQSDPSGVVLQAATPDGHNVFFVTDSPLLDADIHSGPDVYRYTDSANPSSDANLTLISQSGDVSGDNGGGGVVGVSDDGQRVYFETNNELMVWDHGATRLISGSVARSQEPREQLAAIASRPGLGRVTPDGMYEAFITRSTLNQDQVHGLTGEVTNSHFEMYLYSLRDDLRANRLLCVSCPSGAASVDATVNPATTLGDPTIENQAFRPHFLSDRGQVFFSTREQLLPEDTNGVVDAYEYDPASGKLSLLSSGTGRDPATFADASPSGDDVFFVARQRLVAGDRDNLVDLYDARVGPPLPVQPTTDTQPCDGDTCQPPPSADPPEDGLGSLFLDDSSSVFGSGAFAVRQRLVLHGAAGALRVKLSLPGRLRWSGRGLRGGSIRRSRGGTYELRLRLNGHARARLRTSGAYTTVVHLTFIAAGGDQIRRTTRVTFRAPAKKGR